jgi:hypothetical protein
VRQQRGEGGPRVRAEQGLQGPERAAGGARREARVGEAEQIALGRAAQDQREEVGHQGAPGDAAV